MKYGGLHGKSGGLVGYRAQGEPTPPGACDDATPGREPVGVSSTSATKARDSRPFGDQMTATSLSER